MWSIEVLVGVTSVVMGNSLYRVEAGDDTATGEAVVGMFEGGVMEIVVGTLVDFTGSIVVVGNVVYVGVDKKVPGVVVTLGIFTVTLFEYTVAKSPSVTW